MGSAARDAQVSTSVSAAPAAHTLHRNAAVSLDSACDGRPPASTHSQSSTARTTHRFAGLRPPLTRVKICAVVVGMQQSTAADVRRSSRQSKRPDDHCGSAGCPRSMMGSACATSTASGPKRWYELELTASIAPREVVAPCWHSSLAKQETKH